MAFCNAQVHWMLLHWAVWSTSKQGVSNALLVIGRDGIYRNDSDVVRWGLVRLAQLLYREGVVGSGAMIKFTRIYWQHTANCCPTAVATFQSTYY